MRRAWIILSALPLLATCERRLPDPDREPAPIAGSPDSGAPDAARPEPFAVPKGCDINLSGPYTHRRRPSWRYVVEDDGVEAVLRRAADAAGGETAVTFRRTPRGFLGSVDGRAQLPDGGLCTVPLRAEIVACTPGGITVRSPDRVPVDASCHPGKDGAAVDDFLKRVSP